MSQVNNKKVYKSYDKAKLELFPKLSCSDKTKGGYNQSYEKLAQNMVNRILKESSQ